MEKYSNSEAQLQELLETKSYGSLTKDERELVHELMTEEEYSRRHKILAESGKLIVQVVPRPLQLPRQRKGVVVPLYQAVAGIAAAVVLTVLLVRMDRSEIQAGDPKIVATTDTVYQERLRVDTIYVVEKERNTQYARPGGTSSVTKVELSSAPGDLLTIPLNRMDLENKGSSALDDASLSLIRNFQGTN